MSMPPNPYLSYEKDGVDKLLQLCKAMCRIVQAWEAVIRAKYGDNESIIALLNVTLELCALLPAADSAFKQIALDQTLPPADPSETLGINIDAPPASAPDIS